MSLSKTLLLVVFSALLNMFGVRITSDRGHSDETVTLRDTFMVVERQPSYDGGVENLYQHLSTSLRYPLQARKAKAEGTVNAYFNINKDGSISNIEINNGIGSGCDDEVVKGIQNITSFIPGAQRGRKVKTQMTIPITFKINKKGVNPDDSPKGMIIIGELDVVEKKLALDVKYEDSKWIGQLKGADNHPLAGASIVVEGTPYGTVSDLDGRFTVDASSAQGLIITYVGYKTERIHH